MEKENYIFECSNICKSFGGTHALRNAKLQIKAGSVHALLGENGAGKSTLMKCITGLISADSGEMLYQGKPYHVRNTADALSQGISMIYQELNPEPFLSIADSIFLQREFMKGPFLNKKRQDQEAQKLLDAYEFKLKSQTLMQELTIAQCQMVEIIKAVSYNANIIIMDEPTSSLDSHETERLFQVIRDLKARGVAVIYISHRLEEVFEVCDEVTIFRDGQFVDHYSISEVNTDKLISCMVGRKVENIFPKVDCELGDEALRVEGLSGEGFEDISFTVHKGEILGLTGLVGSGRSETVRAIFGLDEKKSGKIFLEGKEIKIHSVRQAIDLGICMVNEDRKNFGLCLYRSLRENISLPNLPARHKGLFIEQRREKKECTNISQLLNVRYSSLEENAYNLSGGNQQKIVLGKWIMSEPKVLILDEPTRGVDVGAKSDLHALMCQLAAKGLAIILISSELPEIMGMSDRVMVYCEGKLNGEIKRSEILSGKIGQEEILQMEFGA